MNIELKQFQQEALKRLRSLCNSSVREYIAEQNPQIISFTAPTGAGKTIIMSALLESIFMGDEYNIEQPNSIAVWLSDDPELNEQSKDKIELRADRIPYGHCVTITESKFDQPVLDDGKIYFINTQKFAVSSNLTKHSDTRQNTIWETLRNTIEQKGNRLYFIIDEAHRGAKTSREQGQATSIMQKFILGDPSVGLPPLPVVIGMSATIQRFNQLASGTQSTRRSVSVSPDEVRKSGLLKDRITLAYPEEQVTNNDIAVLQGATEEWIDKSKHWFRYCQEQHYAHVNPIMLVQVENGTGNNITNTDIADCISKIEQKYGRKFREGELVHSFGSPKSTITFGPYQLPYIEPSRISESQNIKVVFFKDTLSTGWDCPRAETMMSFRRASDSTYIAQLLGRMIRTPKQMRIQVDETLNEVKLFLPHFNEETVNQVIESLKDIEGGDLPTEVIGESMSSDTVQVLSVRNHWSMPVYDVSRHVNMDSTVASTNQPNNCGILNEDATSNGVHTSNSTTNGDLITSSNEPIVQTRHNTFSPEVNTPINSSNFESYDSSELQSEPGASSLINRQEILDFINNQGFKNYYVASTKVNDYLKSLFKLARLINNSVIDLNIWRQVKEEASSKIKEYIATLKTRGQYADAVQKVMEFRMRQNSFDAFGERVDNINSSSLFSSTDSDIDRQFRLSDFQLGGEGIGEEYGSLYGDPDDDLTYKIETILFTGKTANKEDLQEWAKFRFHNMKDQYERRIISSSTAVREEYQRISKDGDAVSEFPLSLPVTVKIRSKNSAGKKYTDHLYANQYDEARICLNPWEEAVIEAERQKPDFVCWLRNRSKWSNALTIPYRLNNEDKPMYPDFLIIRKDRNCYIVDVLEPHNQSLNDNLPKAKGLAEYAKRERRMGRIQLIRVTAGIGGTKHLHRLDLKRSEVRDRVLRCTSDDDLNNIFADYSIEE